MTRVAPRGGYNFAEKMLYRRQVWNTLAEIVETPKRARVLLMPSTEGLEIQVAKEKGFRVGNMYAIDRNPAIVATLRRKYPALGGTVGKEAFKAVNELAASGVRLHAANFDFTGCLNEYLLSELWMIARVDAFADRAAISVTMLRGREGAAMHQIASYGQQGCNSALMQKCKRVGSVEILPNDIGRISLVWIWLTRETGLSAFPIRWGAYRSGTQTMLWCAFEIRRTREVGSTDPIMAAIFSETRQPAMANL